MNLIANKLRVSHFPQIPCKPFRVEVRNEREAFLVYNTIADQHLFLYENNFIPDYSNTLMIQMWDDDLEPDDNGEKWTDYWNEEEVMEWDEFSNTYHEQLK